MAKSNTKEAVKFINRYEDYVAQYSKDNGQDGIVCAHIHHAEIKTINSIEYMNDGDWVELNSLEPTKCLRASILSDHIRSLFEAYFYFILFALITRSIKKFYFYS